MALPEKKGSAISQLEGLLDLLMDLQNPNSTEAAATEMSSAKENGKIQDEPHTDQLKRQKVDKTGEAEEASKDVAGYGGKAGGEESRAYPSSIGSDATSIEELEPESLQPVASPLEGKVQRLNQFPFNTTSIQSSDLTINDDTKKRDAFSELSQPEETPEETFNAFYLSPSDNQQAENPELLSPLPSLHPSQVNGTHQNTTDHFASEETLTGLEGLSNGGIESLLDHPTTASSSSQNSNPLNQSQINPTSPENLSEEPNESSDSSISDKLLIALGELNKSQLDSSENGTYSSHLSESNQPQAEKYEQSTESSSQLQYKPDNYSQESILAYDVDIEDEFERLQKLLLTPDLLDSQEGIELLKEKFSALENQIYDPTNLIKLLLPLITQILSMKIAEAREEMASAIAPIVDQMIEAKTKEDKQGICSALAPIIPSAVNYQILSNPGEFARAIAPEMSAAIKEQIEIERDTMVDALYPVMGGTFYKYLSEAMRAIDQKVENSLSMEGISRKIRARSQGISEAELIFKESMPFTIQAIFLIHKASGLVIAEVQPFGKQHLESDMVAGMLTAIRSFVNDCIIQSGEISELDRIEYGHCDILLEVAGYCYLAVVTQGDPPQSFIDKIRDALSTIVLRHGKAMELFDGDPDNVPAQIPSLLESLTLVNPKSEQSPRKVPVALLSLCASVLGLIFIPWGFYLHQSGINHQFEEETAVALASDPELAVYRLNVEAQGDTITLSGKLPNQYLVEKAGQIAQKTIPNGEIENDIIAIKVPPDPVEVAAEVERVTAILNQTERLAIWTNFQDGKVTVEGSVIQVKDAQKITEALQEIPGVDSVTNTVQLQPLALASRIYFDLDSAELEASEQDKMDALTEFLKDYPNQSLRVIGHSDPSGTPLENQGLALERAKTVAEVLVRQGIDARRLEISGTTKPPAGVYVDEPHKYSRFVEFEAITR
ncbi:OmpA family protein [Coleofasciculus sp.]|uniref:OmpA family protein n=1 Tax=Coleofasciculus sp. TaxID=3100458 RepID=UPI0039FB522E